MRMVEEQENMRVPEELVPYCPACGEPMSINLRCDDTFVEDGSWHEGFLEVCRVHQENFREEGSVSGTWRRDEHPRHHQVSVLENDRRKF